VPHGTIYSVPYFRLQGGANAVILDPQVGDIGIAVFAESDISSVKAAKAQANPGSARKFDMADGLYLGGFLNGTPSQYVQFSASGITLLSPSAVTIQAPTVTIQAPTITLSGQVNQSGGTIAASQDVTVSGLSILSHTHTDPQGGTVGPMQG
jgi:phage baseplate assembly protein gpV